MPFENFVVVTIWHTDGSEVFAGDPLREIRFAKLGGRARGLGVASINHAEGGSATGNDAAYREPEDEQRDKTVDQESLPLVPSAQI